MFQATKKLAVVLIISMSMTQTRKKTILLLKYIMCIDYPVCFKKNQAKMQDILDFCNEINIMTPAYIA